jgi:hypothetical protein
VGANRFATAAKVATLFFPNPTEVGLASGGAFPDALSGGVHIGLRDGPLLLTATDALSPETDAYLRANAASITEGFVYGGTSAVGDSARVAFKAAYSS